MLTSLNVGLALLGAVAPTGQATDISVYSGQALGDGIRAQSWGGGTIQESTEVTLLGAHSLKITTATFHQGGILEFSQPIDVAAASNAKENLLAVAVWVIENKGTVGGSGSGGGPSTGGGPTTGGGTSGQGGSTAPRAPKQMTHLRLLIRTSDKKLSEAILPLATASGSTGKWRRVGIPLSAIAGFQKTNKQIVGVGLAGDAPATFYLGEVRVVNDQTPIQGFLPKTSMNLALGDEATLWVSAEAGLSILDVAWDFDAKDGIQDEAIGQVIYHRFRLEGTFTVTCTIRDAFGLKAPWTGTIQVVVNP